MQDGPQISQVEKFLREQVGAIALDEGHKGVPFVFGREAFDDTAGKFFLGAGVQGREISPGDGVHRLPLGLVEAGGGCHHTEGELLAANR